MNRRIFTGAVIGVTVVTACLLLALGCGKKAPPADSGPVAAPEGSPVLVSTAIQGDIDQSLELTGSAEAAHQVDVVPEVGGKITAVYADIGDHVRRGQPLLRIDTAITQANRRVAQTGVGNARAKLDQSRTNVELTDSTTAVGVDLAQQQFRTAQTQLSKARTAASLVESQVNSQIAQAQNGVNNAATRLAEVKAGSRRQEIAGAKSRLDAARAQEGLARTNYNRTVGLFRQGAVPQATLDVAQNQYEVAQQATRQAAEALDLAKEGSRSEDIRMAEIGLQQAQESLRLAEAGRQQIEISRRDVNNAEIGVSQAEQNQRLAEANRGQVVARQSDVEMAAAGLHQARATVGVYDTQIGKASIYAPISGVIAARMAEVGGNLNAGMGDKAFRILDIDPIYMNATVSELDLAKIKLGDKARVTADGLAGHDFLGTVRDIKPQSQQGQRNYIVRIAIANPAGALKAGMFCRAHLIVGQHKNTTIISRDCLVEEGKQRQVYAVVDNTVKVRDVSVGAISGTQVEILEGVKPGDMLVSTGQKLLADGQTVKPTEKSALDTGPEGEPAAPPPQGTQPQ